MKGLVLMSWDCEWVGIGGGGFFSFVGAWVGGFLVFCGLEVKLREVRAWWVYS